MPMHTQRDVVPVLSV